MKKSSVRGAKVYAIAVAVLALLLVFFFGINRWEIRFTKGVEDETIGYRTDWKPADTDAYITGTLLRFVHIRVPDTVEGEVDTAEIGTYTVTYSAKKAWMQAKLTQKVTVADLEAPVITLVSNPDSYTLPGHPYEEEGYSATDDVDGDLTAEVKREEKDGRVIYTVSDAAGNEAREEREIRYDDRTAPVITLQGGGDVTAWAGESYRDRYSATDDALGDVTGRVKVEGSVDTSREGTYQLTYTVADDYGNTAQAVRHVTVKNRPVVPAAPGNTAPAAPAAPSNTTPAQGKIIFLTFDDGPGPYTDQLLGILAKHGVKATFFVTNAYPKYSGCIAREAAQGHAVGVHTLTHDYAKIYASPDAYWSDHDAMQNIVTKQIGHPTKLMRFPGGSSNAVSKRYCPGIMTTLIRQTAEKGYTYFDWNVSSGDAGGTTQSDQVYQNIVSGVQKQRVSVVLCHDVKPYTVNAMDRVITWGLENGYSFQPLDAGSFPAHHTHLNNP